MNLVMLVVVVMAVAGSGRSSGSSEGSGSGFGIGIFCPFRCKCMYYSRQEASCTDQKLDFKVGIKRSVFEINSIAEFLFAIILAKPFLDTYAL